MTSQLMRSIGERLRLWKSEVWARPLLLVEWCGAGLGVLGAEVLAQKSAYSAYGWVIWLVSNVLWIVFALKKRAFGLLAMQLVFTVTSLQGAVNWLL
ncbi:hypothetical protein PQH03_29045 [Ralstonia insidiosa]|jgi:hypothetical protein|uniref:hypothetical protein n=1 Tax=Ralstonia TaxID=48736 RepID=UPI00046AECB1|nr:MULTISPECIES: hypothetical protein [Ralstonia]KMW47662.1 hypothetical protein AC240_08985 [Ralstonia sp. MD27]MBA9869736.1 hypothetical protein [Ralstonia insidiosa]MBA9885019.1 hypothetical protein [Ralstonia pickettii]MBA9894759.1 hypothetical protein [Ralstonia pickettii]MBA9913555.1 hypothetical protein [Ralstonia insidiosa]